MRKKASTKLPSSDEIEYLAKIVRAKDFIKYIFFADTIIRYIETTMKRDNVSRLQGAVLHYLVLKGGRLTPTQLSRIMFRSKHSITKIIDSLEREGLVIRDNTDKDRRVTLIRITSSGLAYVVDTNKLADKTTSSIIECLTPNEQKSFVRQTEKMRKKMTDVINGQ